ncbi:MAG: DUF2239 family protein [Steroidobacteraceae bacterium]
MAKIIDSYTVFDGTRLIGSGSLPQATRLAQHALAGDPEGPVLIFDDRTGAVVDFDPRRALEPEPVVEGDIDPATPETSDTRSRGRPRLGVVPREVTLLPRHWDWLAEQPGGASVALRKLVEAALRAAAAEQGPDARRRAQERTYRFMTTMAGDLPNYEEATRALFANDTTRLAALIQRWPADIRKHVLAMATVPKRVTATG